MSIKNEILNKMPLSLVMYMRDHKSCGNRSQEIYRNGKIRKELEM